MKMYSAWILGGLATAAGIAACSAQVSITAEKAAAVSGSSSGSSMNVTGSGASGPGGTGSATGTGGSTGTGSSTGSGASGAGKVVTADNDIGQYASISLVPLKIDKVVDGPFFVTDLYCANNGNSALTLDTVTGGDCSVPAASHTVVLAVNGNVPYSVPQAHGIRLPVLSGQTLCGTVGSSACTVLGFKPY